MKVSRVERNKRLEIALISPKSEAEKDVIRKAIEKNKRKIERNRGRIWRNESEG